MLSCNPVKVVLACFLVAGGLFLAPSAVAQSSAIDEYTESPPTADGSGDGARIGGRVEGDGEQPRAGTQPAIPPSSAQRLEQLGPEGDAARELALATAPEGVAGGEVPGSRHRPLMLALHRAIQCRWRNLRAG